MSSKHEWRLKFDGMTYKFIDANNPILCISKTVQHVFGRSHSNGLPSKRILKNRCEIALPRTATGGLLTGMIALLCSEGLSGAALATRTRSIVLADVNTWAKFYESPMSILTSKRLVDTTRFEGGSGLLEKLS